MRIRSAAIGLSCLVVLGSVTAKTQIVSIPDPGLQNAIRVALKKPGGDITRADMAGLVTLDASRETRGFDAPLILSFEGLETAINLEVLDCSGTLAPERPGESLEGRSVVTGDLSRLSNLGKLRLLSLPFNSLTNLTLPTGLTNLRRLDLSLNPIGTLTLPTDMTNLQTLAAIGDGLTKVPFLEQLSDLRSLSLSQNRLERFALPASITKLEELRLLYAGLTEFALPAEVLNLHILSLGGNQLTNVEFLLRAPNVRVLDLSENPLTALTQGLTNLLEVDLSYTQFADLAFLHELAHLEKLIYLGNSLPPQNGLQPLNALANLRELDLGEYPLGGIELPANLASLDVLSLRNAAVTNLILPAEMRTLQSLDLGENLLRSVVLPATPALEHLDVSANRLELLLFPSELPLLTNIDLSANQLTSLALPVGARAVTYLALSHNKIAAVDLSPSRESLVSLSITGNPLNDLAFLRDFHGLQDLSFYESGLRRFTLPEGLGTLTHLGLDYPPCTGGKCISLPANPVDYLAVPASMNLSELTIDGFPKDQVTILGLWMHSPRYANDGTVTLHVNGASGRTVRIDRSTNLKEWEPFETVSLGANGGELNTGSASSARAFFRAVGN